MHTETRLPEFPGNGGSSAVLPAPGAVAGSAPTGTSREFHNLLADLQQLIGEATTLTGADLERLRLQLGERVGQAKHAVEDLGGSIDQQARKAASATDVWVHQQPWNAIGIGVGTGLLIGFLLARRG